MKPRNVVEFSHGLRASAIQFFNDVEKYVDLMANTLVEKINLIVIVIMRLELLVLNLHL